MIMDGAAEAIMQALRRPTSKSMLKKNTQILATSRSSSQHEVLWSQPTHEWMIGASSRQAIAIASCSNEMQTCAGRMYTSWATARRAREMREKQPPARFVL
jgi:hypothetical protein